MWILVIVYQENSLTPDLINALRIAVGWTPFSLLQLERSIGATSCSVTAWSDNHPVGMARLIGDGIYYFLCDVIVIPDFQKHGIGRHMVDHLIEYARQGLAPGERCSVVLVSAEGKENFYSSLGFATIPNNRAGYGMQLFLSK